MNSAEKLNIILMISLVVAFTCGFVMGTVRGDVPQLPANYNPVAADNAAALRGAEENIRTCYQIVREQARSCPPQNPTGAVSH